MASTYAGVRTCLLAGVGEMSGARKADLKCYAEYMRRLGPGSRRANSSRAFCLTNPQPVTDADSYLIKLNVFDALEQGLLAASA